MKAVVLSLPIPFTVATLALGHPPDVTSAGGLLLLLLFTHAVRLLHYTAHWPILPAIALAAAGYCLLSTALAPLLPRSDLVFWLVAGLLFALAVAMIVISPERIEPAHRTNSDSDDGRQSADGAVIRQPRNL